MTTPTDPSTPPFTPDGFVPNNHLDTGPPPVLPDLGKCYIYDRETGNGTTEFMFQPCNAYTYPGEVYFTPVVTNPSTGTAQPQPLPETGSSFKIGLVGTVLVGVGMLLMRLRRTRATTT